MSTNRKICSIFGHRDYFGKNSELAQKAVQTAIDEHKITDFYIGGYGDFDAYMAKLIYDKKSEYDIKLHLVLAYYPSKKTIIPHYYDDNFVFDGFEFCIKKFAITKRNEWMASSSDLIISYVTHNSGGAFRAVKHAKKHGVEIINCSDFVI